MRIMKTQVMAAQTEDQTTARNIAITVLGKVIELSVVKVIEAPKTNPTTTWHVWCDEKATRLVLAPVEWVGTLAARFHNSEDHWHEADWTVRYRAHERAKRDRMMRDWETYWVEHHVAFSIR